MYARKLENNTRVLKMVKATEAGLYICLQALGHRYDGGDYTITTTSQRGRSRWTKGPMTTIRQNCDSADAWHFTPKVRQREGSSRLDKNAAQAEAVCACRRRLIENTRRVSNASR